MQGSTLVSNAQWFGVLAAMPASVLSMVFSAMRLRSLIGSQLGLLSGIKSCALAVALAYISPSKLADGTKPIYLASTASIPMTTGFAALFLERLTDLICILALLVFFVLILNSSAAYIDALRGLAAISVIVFSGFFILMAYPGILATLTKRIPFLWVQRIIFSLMGSVRVLASPARLSRALFYASLTWAASYGIYYFYFAIVAPVGLPNEAILAVFLLSTLGMAAAVLPAGLGTFEAGVVLALSAYGYSLSDSLVTALMLRIATVAPPVMIAFWVVLYDRFDLTLLKRKKAAPPEPIQKETR